MLLAETKGRVWKHRDSNYLLPLCTGAVDPEEKLPEFLEKLEQNGVNT